MKVLVTGGAGFIGSHTTDALLARGHEVRILDSFEKPVHLKGKPAYLPREAEVVEGDVRDKGAWEKALDGVDAVYHLAAYQDYLPDFSKFFHVNAAGTALLYEVAVERRLPLRKVVVASSQAVYGEGRHACANEACARRGEATYPDLRPEARLARGEWDHPCPSCGEALLPQLTDESRVNPQNQYALSKHAQEQLALSLGRRYGIPTTAMRYSIVQGPRQSFYNAYSGACRIFALHYHFDRAPPVYEDGQQWRDFVNVHDVVAANLLVLERPESSGEAYNVGGGRAYTVLEFADIVRREFGSDVPPRVGGEYRFGDTRHIHSDVSKLERLGWRPRRDAAASVAEYAAWLRQQVDVEDILAYAEQRMKSLDVVRKAQTPGVTE